ncbi:MAG: CRISPR-associated endonuclease Cas3'' [bacterium]|nr:CRISPR-associated endonuclease Cas3'' [bacterium]
MEDDDRTRRLLHAPKRLTAASVRPRSGTVGEERSYVRQLAELVLDAHTEGTLTLVILNRVRRAQDLHSRLVTVTAGQPERDNLSIVLLHGRFRAGDRREAWQAASGKHGKNRIVVATQAVEAGVDISAALLITELAPWPSLVQRFGRANRYAELKSGADIRWIDLLGDVKGPARDDIAAPYVTAELEDARDRLLTLTDVAPASLPPVTSLERSARVLRHKDLYDLFDTDPDLTGFDVDVSAYIRDGDDLDIRVFWRDLGAIGDGTLRPTPEELCCAPIHAASDWLKAVREAEKTARRRLLFVSDPQAAGQHGLAASGWLPFTEQRLWPGMTLLADVAAGGYSTDSGFTGDVRHRPDPLDVTGANDNHTRSRLTRSGHSGESDLHGADPLSEGAQRCIALTDHLSHVEKEAETLCEQLGITGSEEATLRRAARWHDLGKIHEVFQNTMRRGLPDDTAAGSEPLAKTVNRNLRHSRPHFRHELASALAFLSSIDWHRDGDLVAYLVAAHHGKVRMSLRALPKERQPAREGHQIVRFARGVYEGDELPAFEFGGGEAWRGGRLALSLMELGESPQTRQSWTERAHDLLAAHGPFRLAWLETILRVADWRASAKEQTGAYDDAL